MNVLFLLHFFSSCSFHGYTISLSGDLANPSNCSDPDGGQAEAAGTSEQNTMMNSDVANPICPIAMDQIPDV